MIFGSSQKVYLIAEAGVNHNGSFDNAVKMVDAAVDAGADCIKFQTFRTELLVSKTAKKADYQKNNIKGSDSQFDMLKSLELSFDEHKKLSDYCKNKEIDYCSTPFDDESIELLAGLEIPFWKIPSGEITNVPYLRKLTEYSIPVIMSTGMAEMYEIAFALNILENSGLKRSEITILHCNTEYPTPMKDVNLSAMNTIKTAFLTKIGYSDHTLGIEVPIASVAMGAQVIEKHFTLNKKLPGPDHAASIDPDELKQLVKAVRNIETAIGNGIKAPSPSEQKNIIPARKSIVAKKTIQKGDIFTADNISVKRPGNGISPIFWDQVIGTIARKNYKVDELI